MSATLDRASPNPDDYKGVIVRANNPIPSECGIFYFEIKIINKGKNGMIGIGYCTKQSDKKIDDFNYINNMLIPGNSKFLFYFSLL
ncbi:hypothetical protein C2G38_2158251 [Gigaspora rosea]|uniref:Uncharacterized protein n=1 Tax=Gigaspora rosea TaxID=44941 RepID=A0A397W2H8_9GLOM|nr:hypothetical protein C2G38_2158251 [Gigaspora rosea]